MMGFLKGLGLGVLVTGSGMLLLAASPLDRGFDRIITHESGNQPQAVGDNGRSRGLAQISYPYYIDAKREMAKSGISPPPYREAVKSRYWSKQLMHYYGLRYCPRAVASGNLDVFARIHNGGPSGCSKPQTVGYLRKVKRNK